MLKERYGHPTDAESLKSFATLAAYRDGAGAGVRRGAAGAGRAGAVTGGGVAAAGGAARRF